MKTALHLLMLVIIFPAIVNTTGCKKSLGINIFTIADDKQLGLQTAQEIANHPADYPLLDKTQYAASYTYLTNLRNEILATGKVEHATDFDWDINIIRSDSVLNAFCTPGGHIYVYSGLIKYLDNASSLAGVVGHEMAHADKRHSTQRMTEIYGIQTLLDIVLGKNQNMLTQVAQQLVSLQFSRDNETEADTYSVKYLCPTEFRADGAADFFQKIVNQGSATPPQFLSTHPNPDNRIQNIESQKSSLGCSNVPSNQVEITNYNSFKSSLP